jgi:4-alpha-glucanotransferase
MKSVLRQLAELNGVQTSFIDAANQRQTAPPEVLAGILKALDVPARNEKEIRDSLRATQLRPYRQGIEPVIVAWDQRPIKVLCRFPAKLSGKHLNVNLRLEKGNGAHLENQKTSRDLFSLSSPKGGEGRGEEALGFKGKNLGTKEIDGERFTAREIVLPPLPFGYHTLELSTGDLSYRALILSAPTQSFSEPDAKKTWGAFLPLYAAHSEESWGAGNFSDWKRLSRWIGSQGGSIAATLPLLSAFLDYPVCEPSPYSPASRLFWNEFYIDITRVPEFAQCREAQSLVRSQPFQTQLRAFRRSEIIDYQAQWSARRNVLELLAKYFFSKTSLRHAQFDKFLRERPELKQYTAFRAVCDTLKTSWHNWPQRLREGNLREGDYEASAQQFHSYVQWLAHEQMDELIRRSEESGVQLYLDLPLGVNPDGYDVWRERDSFALQASAGAPPDLFFSKGQDWGFAPLHPQRIRESGYRYVLAFLRFQMHHARLLRIDHVMGLHRLYWVPRGFEAQQGTYVNYPAAELHALFNIESHRNRTRLVGENLGTVPPVVNESMKRHRLREMFVVQFQERPDPKAALNPPPALSVASVNTHDTPTFAGHWRGDDLVESVRLGLLPRKQLSVAKKNREKLKAALVKFLKTQGLLKKSKPRPQEVLRALLAWLKKSESEIMLINLEDLWLEKRPQNVPGTSTERPNWRRKAKLSLERIFDDAQLRKLIPF